MPYVDLTVGMSGTTNTSSGARTAAYELPSIGQNKGSLGLSFGANILQAVKGSGIGAVISSIFTPTTVSDSTWGDAEFKQQQNYLNSSIGTSVATVKARDEVSEIPKYTALYGYDADPVVDPVRTTRLPSVGAVGLPVVEDSSIPLSGIDTSPKPKLRPVEAGLVVSISPITRIIDEALDDERATGVLIATKPKQGVNGDILLGVNGIPTYEDGTIGTIGNVPIVEPKSDIDIMVPKFTEETKLEMDKNGVLTISRSVVRTDRSNKKQKKDKKGRLGKAYRMMLRIVNNTVGHEMFEVWMAFTDNLRTPVEEGKQHKWMFRKGFAPVYDPLEGKWYYKPVTAKAAIEGFNDGTLELDVAGFTRDVVQNQIEDYVIAKISQGAERYRAQQGRIVSYGFGEAMDYRPDFGKVTEGERTEYFDPDEFIRRSMPNVEFSAKFKM